MTDAPLPPRVQRFIRAHIDSIEKLEVLLLLRGAPARAWTAEAAARELRIMADSAARRLEDLCARELLVQEPADGAPAFRYAPRAEADAVDALATTYAERRVSVITFIFSRPLDAVRSFADAFVLKR